MDSLQDEQKKKRTNQTSTLLLLLLSGSNHDIHILCCTLHQFTYPRATIP